MKHDLRSEDKIAQILPYRVLCIEYLDTLAIISYAYRDHC
jgi:hypothetical protein